MIDHLGIVVSNFAKSKAFYQKALEPLGYKILDQFENTVGFGTEDKADFWISEETDTKPTPLHFAFRGENRDIVKAFHKAGVAAGGKNNGEPGLRPQYHPNYYGAFVLDPDGNNVEAVCHYPD